MPTLEIDGRQLHYLEVEPREGPPTGSAPVLFLHAFPLNSAMWEPQLSALGSHYRIIAPDLMGFGGSDAPGDRSAYSVDLWADQAVALVEHAGLDTQPLVVVGLSMGGYVSFALLRRHPHLVAALVLADTRAEADTPEVRQRREAQQQRLLAGEKEALATEMAETLVGTATIERPRVLKTVRAMMIANSTNGWIGGLEALKRRPDSTPQLGGIQVPTVVVAGEQDTVTPVPVAEAMHAAIPGSRLVVVPQAGHLSNYENPRAFTQALEEFLSSL